MAKALLHKTNLYTVRNQNLGGFSGGMKQRYGILIGNLSALAMKPLGHIAGLGASIVGAGSTLISVPLSIFIGSFYSNSTLPIAIGFFAVGTISILIFNFVNRIYPN